MCVSLHVTHMTPHPALSHDCTHMGLSLRSPTACRIRLWNHSHSLGTLVSNLHGSSNGPLSEMPSSVVSSRHLCTKWGSLCCVRTNVACSLHSPDYSQSPASLSLSYRTKECNIMGHLPVFNAMTAFFCSFLIFSHDHRETLSKAGRRAAVDVYTLHRLRA